MNFWSAESATGVWCQQETQKILVREQFEADPGCTGQAAQPGRHYGCGSLGSERQLNRADR